MHQNVISMFDFIILNVIRCELVNPEPALCNKLISNDVLVSSEQTDVSAQL